jgi:hypothetical protein
MDRYNLQEKISTAKWVFELAVELQSTFVQSQFYTKPKSPELKEIIKRFVDDVSNELHQLEEIGGER